MMQSKNIGYVLIGFSVFLLLSLFFVKADVDRQAAALCKIIDDDPNLDMSQCPAHQNNSSWVLTGAIGIGFLLLGAGLYMVFVPQVKSKELKIDVSKLDEEEKKVVELLKNGEGSSYQSDLMKEMEFSKVRMTRLLDKLESKGVVERKRRGMTNIVVLR